MSAELERDDFFKERIRLFKCAVCWACGEFAMRLLKISKLKGEAWQHLRTAKSQLNKAKDSSRYGSAKSQQVSEAIKQVKDLREQLETLEKKEQTLLAETQEYKNEQKKGAK